MGMSVRSKAWATHAVISFCLLSIVGTWAFEAATHARDSLGLGAVIAFIGIALAVCHTILATGAVAAWGKRPLGVIGIHVACLALTSLFVFVTFVR